MAVRRRDGYRRAMAEAGLPVPQGYEQAGDYLLQGGRDGCRALLARPDRPTAIFCANDESAFGVIHELRRSGLDVPRDVSVVGFDDIYLSQAIYPPLTTVSQPRAEIGRMAMTVLLDLIAGGEPPKTPVMMPTTLMLRESTAPAKQFEQVRG
jgi:LacI family repressor for deo operon, udp, cdd, tsx, nupC, and nupG